MAVAIFRCDQALSLAAICGVLRGDAAFPAYTAIHVLDALPTEGGGDDDGAPPIAPVVRFRPQFTAGDTPYGFRVARVRAITDALAGCHAVVVAGGAQVKRSALVKLLGRVLWSDRATYGVAAPHRAVVGDVAQCDVDKALAGLGFVAVVGAGATATVTVTASASASASANSL